jgi:hypothetical protein
MTRIFSAIRADLIRGATKVALLKQLIESHRRRNHRANWSTEYRVRFETTSLVVLVNKGLGDNAVAKQICEAFLVSCAETGDPRLGKVVITAGAWPQNFGIERGDHNVYWWWSMGGRTDWLDVFLEDINVKPDLIACLSQPCVEYATRLGFKTLLLPLATGSAFRPLDLSRSGIGYAGSRGHKDSEQEDVIILPFVCNPDFEWVHDLPTLNDVSNFYNRKQIILGMTEVFQERTGMVNARFFEVLATGTPFIIHRNRGLKEVLGFNYPYQSSSASESKTLAEGILGDYKRHLEASKEYQRIVSTQHTFLVRLRTLMASLRDAEEKR